MFAGVSDDDRLCYLTIGRLRTALDETRVLDALMDDLEVPGKPNVLKALSPREKLDCIIRQADFFGSSKTSLWFGVRSGDILVAKLWQSSLSNKFVERELFSSVTREAQLLEPVARWLVAHQLEPHAEISMGKKRADLVGHREPAFLGLRARELVAVELKNDIKEMERAIDQMTTYAEYAHRVYLACTPALAIEYLDDHASSRGAKHWDSEILDRKLGKLGLGLLIVEGHSVTEHLKPRPNVVTTKSLDEVLRFLTSKSRVDL